MQREVKAGPYRLGAEIARGGFGTVYHATHVASGAQVAVKILHTELFSDRSATLRFEREAAVVLALPHPNIVKVYECGRIDDGRPFIAMELLRGESVEKRLQSKGRLPIDEVMAILEPLASALSAAHAREIVHRDIKPSNVFLAEDRPEGRVVLLDFGIAKLLADQGPALTASRSTLGTIPFMAPEQIRGEAIDTRADVYALAALAYAMLTGKPPYGDQVTSVLRQLHLGARPQKPSERAPVDPAIDEPLLRALAVDREERPSSAPALCATLSEALRRPTRMPSPSRPDVMLRPAFFFAAELRADAAAMALGEEHLFDAMESGLAIVSAAIATEELVPLRETQTQLICVSASELSQERIREILKKSLKAYRDFQNGPGKTGHVALSILLHSGFLHTNEAGTLLSSGLLDLSSWAPPISPFGGVVASRAVLGDEVKGMAALWGTNEFFWVER